MTYPTINPGAPAVWHDPTRNLFKVSRRSFTDPQVLRDEYNRVFDKCWLYLGHESELARPGDFVTRIVAKRSILFTRDAQNVPIETRGVVMTMDFRRNIGSFASRTAFSFLVGSLAMGIP